MYSRSKRPFGQRNSTKKLRYGSNTTSGVCNRNIGTPDSPRSTINSKLDKKYSRSTPARAKSALDASDTKICEASKLSALTSGISASKRSLTAEETRISPKPNACKTEDCIKPTNAIATASFFFIIWNPVARSKECFHY